jgi:transcriptional regulator with XRE-family HTH domain
LTFYINGVEKTSAGLVITTPCGKLGLHLRVHPPDNYCHPLTAQKCLRTLLERQHHPWLRLNWSISADNLAQLGFGWIERGFIVWAVAPAMERLKSLRTARNQSHGDIEKRTGLLCYYVSRVEYGHAVPKLKNLERWAKALGVEVYQIFFEGEGKPEPASVGARGATDKREEELLRLFRQADRTARQLILNLARKVAKKPA